MTSPACREVGMRDEGLSNGAYSVSSIAGEEIQHQELCLIIHPWRTNRGKPIITAKAPTKKYVAVLK